jgi:hypothetical protein
VTKRITGIGFGVLVGMFLTIGIDADAAAKTAKPHRHTYSHAHSYVAEDREQAHGKRVQRVVHQPTRLEPMRYYGGPKSPMWSGLS